MIQQTPGESSHASALARAGRASKVGSKVGRILRLVRLIKILSLYEQFCWSQARREHEWRTRQLLRDEDDDGKPKTRVGARLSDITTRRVIVGVLTILFFTPVFELSFYPQGDTVTVAVRAAFALCLRPPRSLLPEQAVCCCAPLTIPLRCPPAPAQQGGLMMLQRMKLACKKLGVTDPSSDCMHARRAPPRASPPLAFRQFLALSVAHCCCCQWL